MFHQTRNISGWEVPTVAFGSPARDPLVLLVLGEIIKEFTSNAVRKWDWKVHFTASVKEARGAGPWDPGDDYAVSLAFRFHPGFHGGPDRSLDVENFVKPVLDAVAAGLLCALEIQPSAIDNRVVDGEEAKPEICNIPGDGRTQSAEGGDVANRADKEHPHRCLGMNGGPAEIRAVPVFQGSHQLGEVQLLIDLDQKMGEINEVPQPLAGEQEEGGVPFGAGPAARASPFLANDGLFTHFSPRPPWPCSYADF